MAFFEGLSAVRIRRALNVLLEAPFFYPSDDPELFAWVRRHRVELARFFSETLEWQLVVELDVARVHKARWHNTAITPRQRSSFEPTRAGECVALLLLLDLQEKLRADGATPRFTMGSLLAHAAQRANELGVGTRFDEARLRDLYRDVVPTLIRHRFLDEARDAGTEMQTYEMLPGLRLYCRRTLDDIAVRSALGEEEEP